MPLNKQTIKSRKARVNSNDLADTIMDVFWEVPSKWDPSRAGVLRSIGTMNYMIRSTVADDTQSVGMSELKMHDSQLLTLFNEDSGAFVDELWRRVAERNLPYQRTDVLARILKRGKIRGMPEYEIAVDSVVAAEQEGRITAEQAALLSIYIDTYENRKSRR